MNLFGNLLHNKRTLRGSEAEWFTWIICSNAIGDPLQLWRRLSLSFSLLVASEADRWLRMFYIYIHIYVSKTTPHVDCLRILNPRGTSVTQTEAAARRVTRSCLRND